MPFIINCPELENIIIKATTATKKILKDQWICYCLGGLVSIVSACRVQSYWTPSKRDVKTPELQESFENRQKTIREFMSGIEN